MQLIGMLDSPHVRRVAQAAPARVAPDSAGARRLVALSDEYLGALYPPESNRLDDVEALLRPHVCFLGIEEAGELVACGAVKRLEDHGAYGEIKRVFVLPSQRGKGYGRAIVVALEAELRRQQVALARLEVGTLQQEALGLYRALGYRERGPFGDYAPDRWSVFMEKTL